MTRRRKQPLNPKIAALLADLSPEGSVQAQHVWAQMFETGRGGSFPLRSTFRPPEPLLSEIRELIKKARRGKLEVE